MVRKINDNDAASAGTTNDTHTLTCTVGSQ
jgi:hypothetical protein